MLLAKQGSLVDSMVEDGLMSYATAEEVNILYYLCIFD
jgi:hypothetical protein